MQGYALRHRCDKLLAVTIVTFQESESITCTFPLAFDVLYRNLGIDAEEAVSSVGSSSHSDLLKDVGTTFSGCRSAVACRESSGTIHW